MSTIFVLTVGDVIALSLFAVALLAILFFSVKEAIVQALCKHDGSIYENRACDAICAKCGKNLGFIGSFRRTK